MRKLSVISSTIPVLVAGVLFGAPAQAADRFSVELSDVQGFDGGNGSFTSNIPGCATGKSITIRAMAQFPRGTGVFRGTRVFVCDSGIGTVTVNLSARFGEGGSVGTWSIASGTGELAGARGAGKLVGVPHPDGIQDNYTGTVTVTG
jgi:hypothetical protein